MKEFFRKKMVGLKRKPQTIALVVLVAAFLYYSLNLTQISNTTAKVQGQGMGLAGFVTTIAMGVYYLGGKWQDRALITK